MCAPGLCAKPKCDTIVFCMKSKYEIVRIFDSNDGAKKCARFIYFKRVQKDWHRERVKPVTFILRTIKSNRFHFISIELDPELFIVRWLVSLCDQAN